MAQHAINRFGKLSPPSATTIADKLTLSPGAQWKRHENTGKKEKKKISIGIGTGALGEEVKKERGRLRAR